MGSLSYVCWAFCLAQVALVYARPEFGTSLQFEESPEMKRVTMKVLHLLDEMEEALDVTLSGQVDGSAAQLALLVDYADALAAKGKSVADAFLSTVDATSGVSAAFLPLQSAYDDLMSFVDSSGEMFFESVRTSFSRLVAEELMTSFAYVVHGLRELRELLDHLAQDLYSVEASSEEREVRHHLLREALRALYMIRSLHTVVCVFRRVAHNMRTADRFYVDYQMDVAELSTDFAQDLSNFALQVLDTAYSVNDKFEHLLRLYDHVEDHLSHDSEDQSSSSSASSAYGALVSALGVFTVDGPQLLSSLVSTHFPEALSGYLFHLEATFEENYYQGPGLFVAADELVEGLIASDVFAELCFAKYVGLVDDVVPLGRVRLHECLDTELPRLRKLAHAVRAFVKLLSYDVEDVFLNLEPCVKRKAHRNRCLSQLTGFYTALGNAHRHKYRLLKHLVKTELHASGVRLEICLAASNYYTFCHLVPELLKGMHRCFEKHHCVASCDSNESGPEFRSCSESGPPPQGKAQPPESEMGPCRKWNLDLESGEMESGSGSGSGRGLWIDSEQ